MKPYEVVEAWQDAVNAKDAQRLVELSDEKIEIVGPRGSAYGHRVLKEWLSRAGLTLETLKIFARGDMVVVAQHGVWNSPQGEGEADIASVFEIHAGRVARYARYDSLDDAMRDAGLTVAHEIKNRED